ncbi:DUF2970 domain-containing protein [Psychrosphaera aestuarii]|uniref:DUF2970 domain-containing protein n=1 Tax=Psychrosphaera aestuarii TaxID=1266052 RepID=UPI001B324783|nr:DUF2970 domain-containing protein [Psychrosphaera aestuarii]
MNLIQAFKSVAAAFFGVQKSETHKKDFATDTPFPFILAGVILAVGLVLLLITIVNLVLS